MSTILVIEDDRDTVRILELSLKRAGHQVIAAFDGIQGLKLAQARLPDLVLLDLMLPGLGGLAICERLRADPVTANMPIVIITVRSQEADKQIAAGLNVNGYITKPYRRAELLAAIQAALGEKPPPPM